MVRGQAQEGAGKRAGVLGASFAVIATVFWGAQFPVAKTVLPVLDPFTLTSLRYGLAALLFAGTLMLAEGWSGLRYEGHFWEAAGLGTVGLAGFNLLTFQGLKSTAPENAALIGALLPLLTMLYLWIRRGARPTLASLILFGVALLGVSLVITRGHLDVLTGGDGGGVGSGAFLVLLGTVCWMVYTLGASRFSGWSPLRYTTLTALPGSVAIWLITAIATVYGGASLPSVHVVRDVLPQLLYMTIPAGVVAVLCWNAGVRRLGPQNGMLFMNLVPVVTLVVQAIRGTSVTTVELAGAALTLGALIANNLLGRRPTHAAPTSIPATRDVA